MRSEHEESMRGYADEILALCRELDETAEQPRGVGLTTDRARDILLRAEHIADRARMFIARREAALAHCQDQAAAASRSRTVSAGLVAA